MKRVLFLIASFVSLTLNANHWEPNPYQYQNNMTMVAVVSFDDIEQRSESLEIGAFCGDECRGSVIAQYEENFDRYFFFLMIYGNHDDNISFRCYDHDRGLELDMMPESTLSFLTNAMIGTAIEPFEISFRSYTYNVTLDVMPGFAATYTGDGVYNKYDTCYIQINPIDGYQLDAIIEGADTLTVQTDYSFIVLSDRHLVAYLSEIPVYYQVDVDVLPESAGIVTGAGQYLENDTCYLEFSANQGYDFMALKEDGHVITINEYYSFVVTSDRHFTAEFLVQPNYYQITADVEPDEAGHIDGLGAYQEDELCELYVEANPGYDFIALKENNTVVSDEPYYSFTVDSDSHFTAEFEACEYVISLSANPQEGGEVSGSGTYYYGDIVYAIAVPDENYIFKRWTKDNGVVVSSNPQYVFDVTESLELVAHFEHIDAVDDFYMNEIKVYPNPVLDKIFIQNIDNEYDMIICDIFGRIHIKKELIHDEVIDLSSLPNGTYIISLDDGIHQKKIKIVRI